MDRAKRGPGPGQPPRLRQDKTGRAETIIHSSLALAAVASVVVFILTICQFSRNLDQVARHFAPREAVIQRNAAAPSAENIVTNVTGNVPDSTLPSAEGNPAVPLISVPMEAVPMEVTPMQG